MWSSPLVTACIQSYRETISNSCGVLRETLSKHILHYQSLTLWSLNCHLLHMVGCCVCVRVCVCTYAYVSIKTMTFPFGIPSIFPLSVYIHLLGNFGSTTPQKLICIETQDMILTVEHKASYRHFQYAHTHLDFPLAELEVIWPV